LGERYFQLKKTVLIIDDYEKSLRLFTFIVGSMGYRVLATSDSEEGVKMAHDEQPDLILMDVQMPRMNGIQALKLLRADTRTRDIPIIAVTSYVMKGDCERLVAEGFTHYIAKPIDKNSFMQDVKRIIEQREKGEAWPDKTTDKGC
jgi:two-component system cell cycle response regulator DivK